MKHMLELRAFDTVGTWTAKSQGEVCCFSSQKIPLTWRRASWNFLQDRTWWGVRLVYNFQGQHRRGHSSLSSQSFVLPMHSPGSDSARWAPKASHHRLPGWQSLYHIPRVGSLWLSESCALAQGSYYPTLFSSPIFHRSQTCIVSWEFFLLLLTLPFEFHSFTLFFKYLFICLFLYLAVLGLSWGTQDLRLHCVPWTLSCSMQDLVPQPGIEPRPPALGLQSLSHWTIREVVIVLL